MSLLQLNHVVKQFDSTVVIDNLSLDIHHHEFFTLLGPSGCGKTTLLRMISGFLTPDAGAIYLENQDITNLPPEKRHLHTVFQNYALFPHMTVFDNVAYPLKMERLSKGEIKDRVQAMLAEVKLNPFATHYPDALSGGQKQRVAVARALIRSRSLEAGPKLLLLDEPLSALDAQLRKHMQIELVKLQKEVGITFIYVTHDQSEALALSDRIAILNQGRIEQLGTPIELYEKPNTLFVAEFIGKCNLIPARLEPHENGLTLYLSDQCTFDFSAYRETQEAPCCKKSGYFTLRPEQITLHQRAMNHTTDAITLEVMIHGHYYYGENTLYEVKLSDNTLWQVLMENTRDPNQAVFKKGDHALIAFHPAAGVFIADTV